VVSVAAAASEQDGAHTTHLDEPARKPLKLLVGDHPMHGGKDAEPDAAGIPSAS